ncbi:hypothetical protein K523DRAFT_389033, partial [Schizophyllum commune Tattone D]
IVAVPTAPHIARRRRSVVTALCDPHSAPHFVFYYTLRTCLGLTRLSLPVSFAFATLWRISAALSDRSRASPMGTRMIIMATELVNVSRSPN